MSNESAAGRTFPSLRLLLSGGAPIAPRVLAFHGWDDAFVPAESVAPFAAEMTELTGRARAQRVGREVRTAAVERQLAPAPAECGDAAVAVLHICQPDGTFFSSGET